MWPCGHHHCQKGCVASETRTFRNPCASAPGRDPGRCTWSSFNRSRSNEIEPFEPLISNVIPFLRPRQKRDASMVPTAPPSNSTTDSKASSTSTVPPGLFWMKVLVAREIDHVGAEVAQGAGAGDLAVQPPYLLELRICDPFLQIAAAEVVDLAQLARLEHLAGKANRRHESVVECAHVLDAGLRDALPDLVALIGGAPERLLADDVLARLRCSDGRRGVQVVRRPVVEKLDTVISDEPLPIGRVALITEAPRRLRHRRLVAAADRHEPGHERRRPRHVLDLPVRVRVCLAHEGVAQHADADVLDLLAARRGAHRDEADLLLLLAHRD